MSSPNHVSIADRKGLLHELAQLRGAIYLLADVEADVRHARLDELQHRLERLRAAVRGRGILDPRAADAVLTGLARAIAELRDEVRRTHRHAPH